MDRALTKASSRCIAADPTGAFAALAEAMQTIDRAMLVRFDACEASGWDRSGHTQASPDYEHDAD